MQRVLFAFAAASIFVPAVTASPVVVQPDESTSKDAFVYEGFTSLNFNGNGFQQILSSGRTPDVGVDSNHDTRAFLQFDLTSVTLDPGETASLNLYVGDTSAAGFGTTPSPTLPIHADVYPVNGAWTEDGITWANQPPLGSSFASATLTGTGWISVDITSTLAAWLADPSSNNGLAIEQPDPPVFDSANNHYVVAVYDSANGANRPYLQVVPEPASMALVTAAASFAFIRRRRKV